MTRPFTVREPTATRVPLLISVPHSGMTIPLSIARRLPKEQVFSPEDTDWWVDELYQFAPELGIELVSANYSRFVIDLNRSDEKLYSDGRTETSMVPVSTFSGKALYDPNDAPGAAELAERKKEYYDPYHSYLVSRLAELRQAFGVAVLIDGHSIKSLVPALSSHKFSDFIIGDNLGTTCSPKISESLIKSLPGSVRNTPFKGGFITRNYGKPDSGIHAVQIEMCQSLYMDESANRRNPAKFAALTTVLRAAVMNLVTVARDLA
jgi:N-formylglutamate amidohydrolase